MALFSKTNLRQRGKEEISKVLLKSQDRLFSEQYKGKVLINESIKLQLSKQDKIYDIFLSHSSNDVTEVVGLKYTLEDLGYSVYIDWIDDPELDRSKVNKHTASQLRERMKSCKSLFYAFSPNSSNSKWMPWELGFFDGLKGKSAILPVTDNTDYSNKFIGSEYLGLYYYVTIQPNIAREVKLWIRSSDKEYVLFDNWVDANEEPSQKS
ncbi:toll/interleukin-1 receptor domain-containing protein [Hymenobacter pini]|uniref:toll/interleukin-1 receptor domain-containing protein n=1 Tax=Hymenobacter pini TaxID=2880879 RepID=UPI001CF2C3A0|nr:toll/interleukin-1 receptor domain-containing protein [Hymenobacter pini]MCA8830153.1 toll/interleukin-1 receptor domain-containing protein [Hymenobacter pini]